MACGCGRNALPARRQAPGHYPPLIRAPGGGAYIAPGGSIECGDRCPEFMRRLANDPGVVAVGTLIGGAPARIIAAYCESGSLDANMRKAARDLAGYYAATAAICGVVGVFLAPLLIVSAVAGAIAAILDTLGNGGTPSLAQVSALSSAGGQAQAEFGVDPSKTEAGIQTAAAVAVAVEQSGQSLSLPSVPSSGSPCSAAERDRQRRVAMAMGKAKAKAKRDLCAARGGTFDPKVPGGCRDARRNAGEAARGKAKEKSDACAARGGVFDPTAPDGCRTPSGGASGSGGGGAGALAAAAAGAAAGFAVGNIPGALVGAIAGVVLGSRGESTSSAPPPRTSFPQLPQVPIGRLPGSPAASRIKGAADVRGVRSRVRVFG